MKMTNNRSLLRSGAITAGVAWLFLAGPTNAADLCSGNGGDRAEISWGKEPGVGFVLRQGGKNEVWTDVGSVGTGLNGHVYESPSGKQEAVLSTTILMDANPGWEDEIHIAIFRDRVFWPCDFKNGTRPPSSYKEPAEGRVGTETSVK